MTVTEPLTSQSPGVLVLTVCSEETFMLSAMLTDKEGMGEEEGDSE